MQDYFHNLRLLFLLEPFTIYTRWWLWKI